MISEEWMSRSVITIDQEESLTDAAQLIETRVISTLPVLDGDTLVGILSDGDIKRAQPSDASSLDRYEIAGMLDMLKIKTLMTSPVITARTDHTVDEVAAVMLGNGISGMPVLDSAGKMAGIITKSDIFRCFVAFTGVARNGQIFAFKFKDKPGIIKHLSDTIRNSGGRLSSILTSYDDTDAGFRKVYFNSFDMAPEDFNHLVIIFQKTGNLTYAADLAQKFRRIY